MPDDANRFVITGMGAVTPVGVGVGAYTDSLRAGRSGVRRIGFAHPLMKSTVAACVWPDVFEPRTVMDEADLKRLPRMVPMALAAAREAMLAAGMGPIGQLGQMGADGAGQDGAALRWSRRVGLVLGTGAGGIDFTLDQAFEGFSPEGSGRPSLWTITNATHGNLAGELSIRLGLRGPSWCVSTGCASSSDALGMALGALRGKGSRDHGIVGSSEDEFGVDAFVVVGADAHVRWETLHGMELLRVISTRDWEASGEDPATASRPFDKSRDGFVLGEGAWAVVIERASAARRREVRAIAEVLGYGATCDAYHRVRPAPDMAESARAMRMAVADAGLSMSDVDLIHYHGTGTKLNDACETMAVKQAFGEHARRVRGTSVKSMIGHPQGACGLAALVATVAGMNAEEPFVPPTVNLRERDAECDLEYTACEAGLLEKGRGYVALVNCLAFGAKNSAVVVRGMSGSNAGRHASV